MVADMDLVRPGVVVGCLASVARHQIAQVEHGQVFAVVPGVASGDP